MAFRFVPKPEKAEIPFVDGSVLLIKRPTREERRKIYHELEKAGISEEDRGELICERFIVGWRDITGEDGKELPFSAENRSGIYDLLMETPDALAAFTVFLNGIAGNSLAGSTTSMIMDGTQALAVDASATK